MSGLRASVYAALERGDFRILDDGRTRGATVYQRLVLGSEIDPTSGCWIWQRATRRGGYGTLMVGSKRWAAHRASYEAFVGPIPADLTVDHVCFVRACVNPDHLRLLTHAENASRQQKVDAPKCARGHEWTESGTYWSTKNGVRSRGCLQCRHDTNERFARRQVERLARGELTHGRIATYVAGCRCDSCRGAQNEQYRRSLARRAAA